jgi:hypothetical protein
LGGWGVEIQEIFEGVGFGGLKYRRYSEVVGLKEERYICELKHYKNYK